MRNTETPQFCAPIHGFGLYPRFNMQQEGLIERVEKIKILPKFLEGRLINHEGSIALNQMHHSNKKEISHGVENILT